MFKVPGTWIETLRKGTAEGTFKNFAATAFQTGDLKVG
jgi:hypothetical protein